MSLFRQIPKAVVREVFTHKGLYAYVVPVYMTIDSELEDYEVGKASMYMSERNGIPLGSITIAKFLWKILTVFHPTIPVIIITGEI